MNTYFIRTFGCQMNKNDSEKIAAILDQEGYQEVAEAFGADLILMNTCSVRGKAETRMLGWLGQLKSYKAQNLKCKIGVCGCIPQHAKQEIFEKAPHVDFVFGTNTIHELPRLLARVALGEKQVMDVSEQAQPSHSLIKRSSPQAWVSIMYGCDNFCTYCIVPYTRGREVSRTKESIFSEIAEIDPQRHNEIVLLGQNVNSYGKGLYTDYDFADLLREVARLSPVNKVGFMTSHPKDCTDKLIATIAENPKINREIHLPIQSGDDVILEKMNRKYTVRDYVALVEKLRASIPGVKISTDLIVGFPGETEAQFENTLALVRQAHFSRVNTAAYSPRPLTPAEKMPEQLSVSVKAERLQRLIKEMDREKGKVYSF